MSEKKSVDAMSRVTIGHVCPYCWKESQRRDSLYVPMFNGEDLGFVYVCENCRAYTKETSHESFKGEGRLMNARDRELMEYVARLWEEAVRYRVYKTYHLKRKFGEKLGVDPLTFNLQTLSYNQLYRLRKILKDMITKFKIDGREYISRYVRVKKTK